MTDFDASAARRDLTFTEGDDEDLEITYNDANGNAQDITDWTFWITVKADIDDSDADAVFQNKVTTHDDPTNGVTTIPVNAADTDGEGGNTHVYDLQRKDASGNIKTFLAGQFHVVKESTEAT